VSTALARLRRYYGDELLLRIGNGYELTPLARSLLPSVQESVRLVGHAFSLGHPNQPPAGHRVFTVSLSDYAMAVLSEPLLSRLHDRAPDVSIQMRLATSEMMDVSRGLAGCDLLIAPPPFQPDGQPEVILRDRMVFVADPANPRLRDGRLTAQDLAALPHAAVTLPEPGSDPVAAEFFRRNISRRVVFTIGGWLPLPFLVAGTDLVAAVPERLARRVSDAAGVTVVEPPFGTIELTEAAWWHPMLATDPALIWFRGIIAGSLGSLADGGS
jgi:DNA-binding transcriptional LysR family regulator